MFASVLLMLVAACYSEDTEEAIQEPMPGEWMVISPRVLVLSLMTIFAKIPASQCEIPDNNFEEYSPNKCFTN